MSPKPSHDFEFLLLDGFSNMVLASVMEPLRDVAHRSFFGDVRWRLSSRNGQEVSSSSGLQIRPEQRFDPGNIAGTLVLVAGYGARRQADEALCADLRLAARQDRRMIGIDSAAWLMAAAGLLDGRAATIHWQELDDFAERFPAVRTRNARYVQAGRFITCGGASTALEMTLDLIGTLFGPAAALEASSMFVYDPMAEARDGRGAARLRERGSPAMLQALRVIADHVAQPLTTFELAAKVSMSERSLNRMFQRELGLTPGRYGQIFRLRHARYLAEETALSAEQIALRCGFSSASSLGRAFSTRFGMTIAALRRQRVQRPFQTGSRFSAKARAPVSRSSVR